VDYYSWLKGQTAERLFKANISSAQTGYKAFGG